MGPAWTDDVLDDIRRLNPWHRPPAAPRDDGGGPEPGAGSGVNLCGYFRDESGWGAGGRGYLRALRALGVPVALVDVSDLTSNRSGDGTVGGAGDSHPYDVNLVCVDPGQHYALVRRVGESFFDGRYTIGCWFWELPRFPRNLRDRFAYFDEIWVATSFTAASLAPVSPVPVVTIPPVLVPATPGSREAGRLRLGARPGDFVFLFVFDFHSHAARKNPMAVVEAFRAAFRSSDPARLVLKCVNGDADPVTLAALRARAAGAAVEVHDGYWPAGHVRDLAAACDAYVSLHRSEGLGLTITDAMAAGKPVIATGWSGNMDFMTVANSYPVRFELTEIRQGVGPYRAGEVWAEPSVSHAAELMREVFDAPEVARRRGASAARDLAAKASETAVAGLARQRLSLAGARRHLPAFRREVRAAHEGYLRLTRRVCEAARDATPGGATLAVVSKGDDALLAVDGRRAWHFPRTAEGVYLGYHPPGDVDAIERLDDLRALGARYLVIPGTAFWWLHHYAGFARHLDARHRRVHDDEDCVIFELDGAAAGPAGVGNDRAAVGAEGAAR